MPWPAGKPTRRLLEEAENNLGQKPYPRIAKAENQFQANQGFTKYALRLTKMGRNLTRLAHWSWSGPGGPLNQQQIEIERMDSNLQNRNAALRPTI